MNFAVSRPHALPRVLSQPQEDPQKAKTPTPEPFDVETRKVRSGQVQAGQTLPGSRCWVSVPNTAGMPLPWAMHHTPACVRATPGLWLELVRPISPETSWSSPVFRRSVALQPPSHAALRHGLSCASALGVGVKSWHVWYRLCRAEVPAGIRPCSAGQRTPQRWSRGQERHCEGFMEWRVPGKRVGKDDTTRGV